jgi:hypothetical protein
MLRKHATFKARALVAAASGALARQLARRLVLRFARCAGPREPHLVAVDRDAHVAAEAARINLFHAAPADRFLVLVFAPLAIAHQHTAAREPGVAGDAASRCETNVAVISKGSLSGWVSLPIQVPTIGSSARAGAGAASATMASVAAAKWRT